MFEGPRFETGDWLFNLSLAVVHFSPSRQIPGYALITGDGHFLTHPFKVIIHQSSLPCDDILTGV
jgi:hypothetical protein